LGLGLPPFMNEVVVCNAWDAQLERAPSPLLEPSRRQVVTSQIR